MPDEDILERLELYWTRWRDFPPDSLFADAVPALIAVARAARVVFATEWAGLHPFGGPDCDWRALEDALAALDALGREAPRGD